MISFTNDVFDTVNKSALSYSAFDNAYSLIKNDYLSTVGALRHAIFYDDDNNNEQRIDELLNRLDDYASCFTTSCYNDMPAGLKNTRASALEQHTPNDSDKPPHNDIPPHINEYPCDTAPSMEDIAVARQCVDRLLLNHEICGGNGTGRELTFDEALNLRDLFYLAYPESP